MMYQIKFVAAVILVFTFLSFSAESQNNTNNATWERTASREISTGENGKMTPPHKDKSLHDITLTEAIVNALQSGQIKAYSTFDIGLSTELTKNDIADIMGTKDEHSQAVDHAAGTTEQKITRHRFNYNHVHSYRILEHWAFDLFSGKSEIQILGIAPVREVYGSDGDFRGVQAMFWLHYDDAKKVFDQYEKAHPNYSFRRLLWNDYFSAKVKPAIDNGIWQTVATSIMEMQAEKDDTITHHLRNESEVSQESLFSIFFDLKYSGKVAAYSGYDNGFMGKLKPRDVNHPELVKMDTIVVMDPVTNIETEKVIIHFYDRGDNKFELLEKWSLDAALGKTTIEIAGIAPLRSVPDHSGSNDKLQVVYWFPYTDISQSLCKYDQYHPKNTFAGQLWDSYFMSELKPGPLK